MLTNGVISVVAEELGCLTSSRQRRHKRGVVAVSSEDAAPVISTTSAVGVMVAHAFIDLPGGCAVVSSGEAGNTGVVCRKNTCTSLE